MGRFLRLFTAVAVALGGLALGTLGAVVATTIQATAAHATDSCSKFVAPPSSGGSDSNPGTSASPYATIQKGLDNTPAGSSTGPTYNDVCVRNGDYAEQIHMNNAWVQIKPDPNNGCTVFCVIDGSSFARPSSHTDCLACMEATGDQINGVVVQASNGRGVEMGADQQSLGFDVVQSNWTSGIIITSWNRPSNNATVNATWVEKNVQEQACGVDSCPSGACGSGTECGSGGGWSAGIQPCDQNNCQQSHTNGHDNFSNNRIFDNHGEGAVAGFNDNYAGNEVFDNWSVNLYNDGRSGITYFGNNVYSTEASIPSGNCGSQCFRLVGEGIAGSDESRGNGNHNTTIANNFLTGNLNGVDFFGNSGQQMNSETIVNNTAVNTENAAIHFDSGLSLASEFVENNLLWQNSGQNSIEGVCNSTNGTVAVNLVRVTTTCNAFQVTGDPNLAGEGVTADDGIVNDFKIPSSSSTAYNSGTSNTTVTAADTHPIVANGAVDYFGTSRPQHTSYDVGAHELI